VGNIFELMPFDNGIAVVECNGKIVQQLMNKSAAKGGWAISGMTYMIMQGTAEQIYINNKKLDTLSTYHFVCSDYIANGGDDCSFLMTQKKTVSNLLFRNLLIEYIRNLSAEGKSISSKLEHRTINE
jgi:2',3'-cyclic-nucleotide 2'-phosphodiesterase (5'-nucleotidase family)